MTPATSDDLAAAPSPVPPDEFDGAPPPEALPAGVIDLRRAKVRTFNAIANAAFAEAKASEAQRGGSSTDADLKRIVDDHFERFADPLLEAHALAQGLLSGVGAGTTDGLTEDPGSPDAADSATTEPASPMAGDIPSAEAQAPPSVGQGPDVSTSSAGQPNALADPNAVQAPPATPPGGQLPVRSRGGPQAAHTAAAKRAGPPPKAATAGSQVRPTIARAAAQTPQPARTPGRLAPHSGSVTPAPRQPDRLAQLRGFLWDTLVPPEIRWLVDPARKLAPKLGLPPFFGGDESKDVPPTPQSQQQLQRTASPGRPASPGQGRLGGVAASLAPTSGPGSLYNEQNLDLHRNAEYAPMLVGVARSVGLPPHTLAAIIGAEAAVTRDGRWVRTSRTSGSAAHGLTQFVPGTWKGLAETKGGLLNAEARARGLVNGRNKVIPGRESELLALRDDPRLAMLAGAEYARNNLAILSAKGLVPKNASPAVLAKLAYVAHHEGPGKAAIILSGGIPKVSLKTFNGNVPQSQRALYLSRNGMNLGRAYVAWLSDYTDRKIDLTHYMRDSRGVATPRLAAAIKH